MQTSELGIVIIKHNEGFVGIPTPDNGHMAIGHGHDIVPGEDFSAGITRASADTLLRKDLVSRDANLNAHLEQRGITANQNQFDALSDFQYNLGEAALDQMLANHPWADIPNQIPRWCHEKDPATGKEVLSAGLLARRESEVALFNTPISN